MEEAANTSRPGIAIDSRGGAVIDPTENVIALVKAGQATADMLRTSDQRFLDAQLTAYEKLQNVSRDAESKFQNLARDAEARFSLALNAAETRRIDQLASTRQEFQNTIRDMLAESVRTTSSLVSTQLVQIQATFDARVTKLEQAQLTQAGRSSVADPATEATLARITGTLTGLTAQLASMQMGESATGGRARGIGDANTRIMAMIVAASVIASPIIALFALHFTH